MSDELKPCPFCGGADIRVSDKTITIRSKRKRHVSCYCNDCHCYGARLVVKQDDGYPHKAVSGSNEQAINEWNKRHV